MAVNHFRIGEALFFAKDLFTGETIEGMHNDVFRLYAEIIEITEKPNNPTGELGENVAGHTYEVDENADLSRNFFTSYFRYWIIRYATTIFSTNK